MAGGFYIDIDAPGGKPSKGRQIFGRPPDFAAANVMLWSNEPIIMIDEKTVVLGYLFRKGSPSVRVHEGAEMDGRSLAAANGRALISGYWGSYVFVHVTDGGGLYVMRDPSGLLPCYLRRTGAATALAGDITDLAATGPGRIDFEEIGRILASGDARGRNTCIVGIEDSSRENASRSIIRGPRLSDGGRLGTMWHPAEFPSRRKRTSFARR